MGSRQCAATAGRCEAPRRELTSQVMAPHGADADTARMNKTLLGLATAGFAILTAAAVWQHGVTGIFAAAVRDLAALQIFVDLVIALVLVMAWIWADAKRHGGNPWPWLVATVFTGSFGPLVYLLTSRRRDDAGR